MASHDKLAGVLVSEVPLAALQGVLNQSSEIAASLGGVCGNGCTVFGSICGLGCTPLRADAPHVIDREGTLGITKEELAEIKQNFPELRQAVARQVEWELNKLK
jgi:hypothetical protein